MWDGLDSRDLGNLPEFAEMQSGITADFLDDYSNEEQDAQDYDVEEEASSMDEAVDESAMAHVEILGLQDSGTNLLSSMLHLNFRGRISFYDSSSKQRRGIWKHANLKAVSDHFPEALTELNRAQVFALAMTREPMSWLQSVRKAPYELASCVAGDYWLIRPCQHRVPAGYMRLANGSRISPGFFGSLPAVWNDWTTHYLNLTAYGFTDGLVIRYEDMVMDPETVIRQIGSVLNLPVPEPVILKTEAAKSHGKCLGREEAVAKLTDKTYVAAYENGQRWQACERLDSRLMRTLGYSDCEDVRADAKLRKQLRETAARTLKAATEDRMPSFTSPLERLGP